MPKERTALIDGDIVAYRCGFASEKKQYTLRWHDEDGKVVTQRFEGKRSMNDFLKEHADGLGEYEWTSELVVEPLSYCLATVKHMLSNIVKAGKATNYIVYLSDKHNFREDIATVAKYKGNRDDKRKPIHHSDIIKYLLNNHEAVITPNMEADDILADTQVTWNEAGKDTYIASIDKDLLQIAGKHYNFVNETFEIVTPEQGVRKLYEQMLTGDRTDNIPGIKGIGPVKAQKLLENCTTEEEMYKAVYDAWVEYLNGDTPPEDWLDCYDDEDKMLDYHDHLGDKQYMSLGDWLEELKRLLKIGVPE